MSKIIVWLVQIFVLTWLLSADPVYAITAAPRDFCISNKVTNIYLDSSGENLVVEYSATNSTPTSLNIQEIDSIQVDTSSNQIVNLRGGLWAAKISLYEQTRKAFETLKSKLPSSAQTQVKLDYSSILQKPDKELVTCSSQGVAVQFTTISPELQQKIDAAVKTQEQVQPPVPPKPAPPVNPPAAPVPPHCTPENVAKGKCTLAGGQPCDNHDPLNPGFKTAIGCIHTAPAEFAKDVLKFAIGIGGGLAFLMMLLGAFQMLTSAGNPDSLKAGQDRLTSAVIGLLFVIFAVLLLQIIGANILGLPDFTP